MNVIIQCRLMCGIGGEVITVIEESGGYILQLVFAVTQVEPKNCVLRGRKSSAVCSF